MICVPFDSATGGDLLARLLHILEAYIRDKQGRMMHFERRPFIYIPKVDAPSAAQKDWDTDACHDRLQYDQTTVHQTCAAALIYVFKVGQGFGTAENNGLGNCDLTTEVGRVVV